MKRCCCWRRRRCELSARRGSETHIPKAPVLSPFLRGSNRRQHRAGCRAVCAARCALHTRRRGGWARCKGALWRRHRGDRRAPRDPAEPLPLTRQDGGTSARSRHLAALELGRAATLRLLCQSRASASPSITSSWSAPGAGVLLSLRSAGFGTGTGFSAPPFARCGPVNSDPLRGCDKCLTALCPWKLEIALWGTATERRRATSYLLSRILLPFHPTLPRPYLSGGLVQNHS